MDGINGYICECNVNYTGSHCDLIDYCAIHSAEQTYGCAHGVCCDNGGTCINDYVRNGHTCNCTGLWLPLFSCRRYYDPCISHPCQNNGLCNTHGDQYTCNCVPSELYHCILFDCLPSIATSMVNIPPTK